MTGQGVFSSNVLYVYSLSNVTQKEFIFFVRVLES